MMLWLTQKKHDREKCLAQNCGAVHQAWLLILRKSEEAQLIHGILESFGPSSCDTVNVSVLLDP